MIESLREFSCCDGERVGILCLIVARYLYVDL